MSCVGDSPSRRKLDGVVRRRIGWDGHGHPRYDASDPAAWKSCGWVCRVQSDNKWIVLVRRVLALERQDEAGKRVGRRPAVRVCLKPAPRDCVHDVEIHNMGRL